MTENTLSPDSPVADVRDWLQSLREDAADLDDPLDRATIREQAMEALKPVEAVSSPARMVDAALDGVGPSAAGDELQGDSLALEDPEPVSGDVDGAALLDDLEGTFTRFLALPDGAAPALALWTVHAHAHDASPVSPVLAITSPEKRCGKTTLLELFSALVPRPLPASNLTPAVVFRAVEAWRPTLLVDEADTYLREGSELRGVLNSGHRRSLAFVPRCVGDDNEVRHFRTWAPKAVALIGELPDTLADRSVEVRMRRRAPDEEVERLRLARLERELEPLRRRAWTWARDQEEVLPGIDPKPPDGLHDRERDNWRPLLAIADAAGGRWPDRGREAAVALREGERDDRSLGTRLLADVRKVLEDHPSDRIRSKKLVKRLCALEEAPWSEYKGRGLSPVSLANFLRGFDVSSKTIRFEAGSYKGYKVDAFEDAFRRYLETPSSATPGGSGRNTRNNPCEDRGYDGSEDRNSEPDVTAQESLERPGATRDVTGVPGPEGGPDGGEAVERDLFSNDAAGGQSRSRTCACGTPTSEDRDRCDSCRERMTETYLALPDPDEVEQFGDAHPTSRPPAGGWEVES